MDKITSNTQTIAESQSITHSAKDWSWRFWFLLPLYPQSKRRTLRTEVVKDTLWTFEQVQGILYVVVPVRMTIVRLEEGGLLVYAPVAPTPECIRLVNELITQHGDIRYIILPTISGLEHKIFVGPFARHFPQAQVFVAPQQWSFPLNLPLSWLGFPWQRTAPLPTDSRQAPFAGQFDYAILGPIDLGPGRFSEVAFFHRQSHTLLVTDTIVSIPAEPPTINQLDPYPLLFHARDAVTDSIEDTAANRRKGWQRIALFTFYFRPSALAVGKLSHAARAAFQAPDRSRQAFFGLFPFQWQPDWQRSFETLRRGGRLLVAPVLRTLILNRAPQETIDWATKIAQWNFQQIIPCHLDAPISTTPQQFRQAFRFLEKSSPLEGDEIEEHSPLPVADCQLLQDLNRQLVDRGIVPAEQKPV